MGILDSFRLDGKTALVTGCRRGMGRAMAVALAEAGADIVGVSATLEDSGSLVESEVQAAGRSFRSYRCDFASRSDLYRFLADVKREVPQIDILVNNAGTTSRKPAAEYRDEYWDRVLEVNLNAQFILTREIGRDMLERGSGKIIFIASLLSFQGGITVPAYAAAKGGVARLTNAFANEWAGRGVNVNAIAPGYIETDLNVALIADKERSRKITDRIPAGRWGRAEDMKGAVVYLASDASSYVHGAILAVDGGWLGR